MSWATRRQVAYGAVNRQLGGVSVVAGALSGVGIFDMPSEQIVDGMVITTGYRLDCDAATFGELGYGASVTVDGDVYRLQENMLIGDGSLCRMLLERVGDAPPWVPGATDVEIILDGDFL